MKIGMFVWYVSDGGDDVVDELSGIIVAFGTKWAYCVNTRIAFEVLEDR